MAKISVEEKLKKEIANKANELMADWPSTRNRQKQFVLEYVATGFTNASEAARNAGYSEKSARNTANKMLSDSDKFRHILEVVNELKKAYQERQSELKIADGTEVLQRLTRFGRQEPMEKYYKSEKTVDGEKFVEENIYTTTPSDEDAIRALDLLGKSHADQLRQELTKAQIDKVYHDMQTDDSQEDKLNEFMNLLGDQIDSSR